MHKHVKIDLFYYNILLSVYNFKLEVSIQQQNAATNIYNCFLTGSRYAILKAQCQSGKTGCYHYLVNKMLLNKSIERVYILCGTTDLELRQQAWNDSYFYNNYYTRNKKLIILFRQDFKRHTLTIKNSLIIVDESHLDQSKDQELDKFLRRHLLSLDGASDILVENNCYILSVDATPYAELAALVHKETPFYKHVEELVPGDNYYGIADYLNNNLIHATYNITQHQDDFIQLVKSCGNKWSLIRLTSGKFSCPLEITIKNICENNNWPLYYYTSDKTEINITTPPPERENNLPCLQQQPDKPSIVIIKGRLRAGKVVDKKYIGFVWEGAEISKTDSLAQGLPGRMCGYVFGSTKPVIFVPLSAIKPLNNKLVTVSELDRVVLASKKILPQNATNLNKCRIPQSSVKDGVLLNQSVPIRLDINIDNLPDWNIIQNINTRDKQRKNIALKILINNLDCIHDNTNLSSMQKTEILNFINHQTFTCNKTHLRNFKNQSQVKYYKRILHAYNTNTVSPEHISDFPTLTFLIPYKNYIGLTDISQRHNPLHMYIICYTVANTSTLDTLPPPLHNISQTNGKSIFCAADSIIDSNNININIDDMSNIIVMEKSVREYIQNWQNNNCKSTVIKSSSGCYKLLKTDFNYTSCRDNLIRVLCNQLSNEFNIKLTTTYARASAGHFNLKSISW